VGLDDPLDDVQAQASALRLAAGPVVRQAEMWLEDRL